MRQLLGMAALVLAVMGPAKALGAAGAPSAPDAQGALVIIGGALRADNGPVWQRIVQLAGGKGAVIAVLPTASSSPEQAAQQIIGNLRQHGANAFMVPVAPKLAASGTPRSAAGGAIGARLAADDPAIAARVRAATGVFFSGGDQGRITQALRRADGSHSRVLDAIWSVYRSGGVIAGTSAGAAIMSSTMFYQPGTVFDSLAHGLRDGVDLVDGLGFIGDKVFIDQHMLVRGRFARMLPAMLKTGYRLGLGVDENTAIVVTRGSQVEVVGQTGALLLDLGGAVTNTAIAGFNLSNARISYLDSGDRIDLATGDLTPGPGKHSVSAAPAVPTPPKASTAPFAADILAHSAVLNLLERLMEGDQRKAVGLAIAPAGSATTWPGFEFAFSRVAETRAYLSALSETMSISGVRVDVRPVEVPQPFYH